MSPVKKWFLFWCVSGLFVLSVPAGEVRLLAYNIKHGRGMDGKIDLKRIAKVIAAHQPDLVALQEVDNRCTRSGEIDQAAELGRLLGMHHAFGTFMDFQGGQYGMAVLSRFPIKKAVRHQLPEGAEPRCAMEIEVEIRPGDPFSFISIHNDWTKPELRVPQVKALLETVEAYSHPVVLAGDFNATRDDASMTLLKGWNVARKEGAPDTFPSVAPKIEIDYFVIRGWRGVQGPCRVGNEQVASDHRPVFMVLETK